MKNGKRIVLEASEGITFRVQKGTDEIVIKAIKEDSKTPNSFYSYRKPKVPEGYRHVYGDEPNEGFIIENTEDGSEFEAPFVLNATYASVNQILNKLEGIESESFNIKYELCEIILCEPSDKLRDIGFTVMDGPFFSIMPFGKTGL